MCSNSIYGKCSCDFEVNLTNIKGGCQSGRNTVPHDSKSNLPLKSRYSGEIMLLFFPELCRFRCMDLDGDGYLSMYELEYFYEEQLQRMEQLGIETLPFEDCLCQVCTYLFFLLTCKYITELFQYDIM